MAAYSTSAQPRLTASDYILPITAIALALRVLVAIVVIKTSTPDWLYGQATELSCIAQSVLAGHGYGSPFCGNTGPSAFLAPGYPLFVAAVFRVFGVQTMQSAACIMLIQAFLSAATVPVAMLIARRRFGSRAAILTGILVAINPWLIGLEAVLWETTYSILSLTAIVGIALLLYQSPTKRRWATAFLILALAVAVNPSLVLAGLVLYAAAHLLGPDRKSMQWLLPAILFIAFCSLWPIRNWRTLHAFVPMRTNMGYEIWQGNHPGGNGFFQANLHPNVNRHEYRLYGSLGEIAYMKQKSVLANTWIKRNPTIFAPLTLKRIACFWLGIGRKNSALLVVTTAALSLAGIWSLLALFRRNWRLATLFAVPLLILPLPYYLAHPDFRFWCLLAPTLTILAAWYIARNQPAFRQQ
jgi:4-amino-4-deoxy-L-arabinose transferase-like glycosyltransferase